MKQAKPNTGKHKRTRAVKTPFNYSPDSIEYLAENTNVHNYIKTEQSEYEKPKVSDSKLTSDTNLSNLQAYEGSKSYKNASRGDIK